MLCILGDIFENLTVLDLLDVLDKKYVFFFLIPSLRLLLHYLSDKVKVLLDTLIALFVQLRHRQKQNSCLLKLFQKLTTKELITFDENSIRNLETLLASFEALRFL